MKTYKQFHGDIPIKDIGKELRKVAKTETQFKILTGYGSSSGISKSKSAALTSLKNMKKEGLIRGYFPAEIGTKILKPQDAFYDVKLEYEKLVKFDSDYKAGNDGIIFVFVK